jgi:hypothetical protein
MNRLIFPIVLALIAGAAHAELTAPVRTIAPVTDPSMVVIDRGARLEVFPTKRAVPSADSAGRAITHRIVAARADAAIGPQNLGVVYNHAMQQQGYISGEIVFKMKAGRTVEGFNPSLYPGLKKITNPEVYVINTRTPAEFLKALRRLQSRHDLEWVEPSVSYGLAGIQPGIR